MSLKILILLTTFLQLSPVYAIIYIVTQIAVKYMMLYMNRFVIIIIANLCSNLSIDNGDVKVKDFDNKILARYHCYEGYILVGSPLRTCENKKWMGTDPVCKCKISSK